MSKAPTYVAAKTAFDAREFETCLTELRAMESHGRMTAEGVLLLHDTYMKVGELSRALGELNRLRQNDAGSVDDSKIRRLIGRLIETDTTWQPSLVSVPAVESQHRTSKRILHILKESLPYVETGFTMRSRMTLAAQAAAGFEPEVVTSLGFPRWKRSVEFSEEQLVDGVRHRRLDSLVDPRTLPADVVLSRTAKLVAEIAAGFDPAIIQAGTGYRGFDTALVGISVADHRGVPFVYEVRGFQEATWTGDATRAERGEYYRRRFAQEDRCMARADRVITIGEAMAREIIERGIDEEKVSVVPNAVDVDRFSPRPKPVHLVERYGLADRAVVGYISNLGAREGIDVLIRAIGALVERQPDIVCLVAGDGPERPALDRLVADLGLERSVILTGHIPNEDIEDHYALIDIFVVPRIDDRAARLVTPLKPLEAMSMGLPVIVSSLPALEELAAPGVRGRAFPPGDANSLAMVIEELLADDAQREDLARSGQAWVRAERTIASNARRYEEILRPLAS